MKVLIAIDSFKGSMSSSQANNAVKKAFSQVFEDFVDVIDLADGGEGTIEAFNRSLNGEIKHVTVHDSLGRKTDAKYLTFEDDKALIELAEVAGLNQLSDDERDPLHTTTSGVGELFEDAVQNGAKHVYIGIGGSATNDGGIGFLNALGVEFLDEQGKVLPPTGDSLDKIQTLSNLHVLKAYEEVSITILCDVTNPLLGKNGAAHVYGPQKGATKETSRILDEGLNHYADVLEMTDEFKARPGMGAAGGFPLSLTVFFDTKMVSGFDVLSNQVGLKARMENADLIITGEGAIDASTLNDKGPFKIGRLANSLNKPVIAFAGSIDMNGVRNLYPFDGVFSIMRKPMNLRDALRFKTAEKQLYETALEVARTLKIRP